MKNFIPIDVLLPEKGKDIIGVDTNNKKHFCFRCACNNPDCNEWRSSVTGGHMLISILKWKYDE